MPCVYLQSWRTVCRIIHFRRKMNPKHLKSRTHGAKTQLYFMRCFIRWNPPKYIRWASPLGAPSRRTWHQKGDTMITDQELLKIWFERWPLKETKQLLDILAIDFDINHIKLLRLIASELPPVYAAAPRMEEALRELVRAADEDDGLQSAIAFAEIVLSEAEGTAAPK